MADAGALGSSVVEELVEPARIEVAGRELRKVSRRDDHAMWSTSVGAYPIVIATRVSTRALPWKLTAFVLDEHGVQQEIAVFARDLRDTEALLCRELFSRDLGAWAIRLGLLEGIH